MARRELGPATLSVVQAVSAALTPDDVRLLVACSGGADSLALAYAAHYVAQRRGLPCSAVVVDHGLQPHSARVAERARTQLVDLGLTQVRVVAVQVERDSGQGLEAAARAARYAALVDAAWATTADVPATVLLGHTLDDQAETVLLGLARGSGTRSLAGMAPRVDQLLRPLLALRRASTEQACQELGLEPWSDPHNTDRHFRRVRVREQVLPVLEAELGPGVAEALARTATLARDDADLLDRLAADADLGAAELDTGLLAGLPRAVRTRVIRRWLLREGVRDASAGHIAAVDSLVTDWRGQGPIDVPGGAIRRLDGQLVIRR